VYVFGTIVYLLLGSGEKQWWADGVEHEDNKKTTQITSSLYCLRSNVSSNSSTKNINAS